MLIQDTYAATTAKVRSNDTPWYLRVWYVWALLGLGLFTALVIWYYQRRVAKLEKEVYHHQFERLLHNRLARGAELEENAFSHKLEASEHKKKAEELEKEAVAVREQYTELKDQIEAAVSWTALREIDEKMD